jgi:predicted outer membrane repeat protein
MQFYLTALDRQAREEGEGPSIGIIFRHCTFSGNSADRGGGIYIESSFFDRIKVYDSILFGDDARSSTTRDEWDTGYETFYKYLGIKYTDVLQEIREFVYSEGNFAADPSFVDPVDASHAPTSTGDYHLQPGSPCEGSADPSSTVDTDIDGQMRPLGSSARDCGADEIDIVRAAKAPVSITIDMPELTASGPVAIPPAPSGIADPGEPAAISAPTFVEREDGYLLVGSGVRVAEADESASRVGKGWESRNSGRPLGMPTSVPLAVGFASMAALAWKAVMDLLRSLH